MEQNLSNEVDIRREKIAKLWEMGEIPYKAKFERTCTIKEALCGKRKFDLQLYNLNSMVSHAKK